ncbi:Protein of unknown function [Limimonas halophila]|uniref:YetF C-terminal domain-containing protein n=1 Tax=Limimonas halophila TaxID=1082479 RepID=A0A1G7L2I8_9PROT|nr:YetF domain-containing protein [Limimonas halophila]SDF43566.1 Protein of unknown function [Limimonas halophila]
MMLEWFAPALWPIVWVAASTAGMYLAVLGLARWSGVRSFAQMSTFDIAVTIAIGSLLATTVAAKNPPLLQGLAAVATLYTIQLIVSRLRVRWDRVERTVDNAPILLMGSGGELKHANMRVARITEDDLRCHLRKANVVDPAQVQAVVMEGTGTIHVLHHHGAALPWASWILHNVRDYSATPPAS